MKILGNEAEEKLEDLKLDLKQPAVIREDEEEIPLPKAITISAIGHPLSLGLLWLIIKIIIIILALLGISLSLFDKPEPKVRDIEFVLVNKPDQTPINKHTKYRADRNQRAGGKHDPKKVISVPEPVVAKSAPQKKASPNPLERLFKPQPKPKAAPQPRPVPPRPSPQQEMPKPTISRPTAFPIPVPKTKGPKTMSPRGGPVTSSPLGSSSANDSPNPVMSSGGYGSPGRSRNSSGYSPGGGNAGNPSPGNPGGAPGIDAIKEPDFGPYMAELQRTIKRNWDPPRGEESKRVVVLFKIARDGRLISLSVQKSSGVLSADNAAKAAVELSAPFKRLPPEYRGNDVDIQFTFDYNVFGVGGRRY